MTSTGEAEAARAVIAAYEVRAREVTELLKDLAQRGFDGLRMVESPLRSVNYDLLLSLPKVQAASVDSSPEDALKTVVASEIRALENRPYNINRSELFSIVFGFDASIPKGASYFERRKIALRTLGLSENIRLERLIHAGFEQLAKQLMNDPAPTHTPPVPVDDTLTALETALSVIVRKGLPVTPQTASPELILYCLGIDISQLSKSEILPLVKQLNEFLCAQLDNFEVDELALPARILFAHAPGTKGTKIGLRQVMAGEVLGRSPDRVRKDRQPAIISAFAWQVYRAGLTREPRPGVSPSSNPE